MRKTLHPHVRSTDVRMEHPARIVYCYRVRLHGRSLNFRFIDIPRDRLQRFLPHKRRWVETAVLHQTHEVVTSKCKQRMHSPEATFPQTFSLCFVLESILLLTQSCCSSGASEAMPSQLFNPAVCLVPPPDSRAVLGPSFPSFPDKSMCFSLVILQAISSQWHGPPCMGSLEAQHPKPHDR